MTRVRDRRISESRVHRDPFPATPFEERDYGRWLMEVVARFGAGHVAHFNRCPSGWTFREWQARRAATSPEATRSSA